MGLTTSHVHDDLLRLAEGRLAPDERRRVEAHLAGCPACRLAASETFHLVDSLQALPAALSRLPDRRPFHSAQGWPAVWDRVGGSLALSRPLLPALRPMSLYVSLVSVLFVFAMAFPAARGPVRVTANLAQTPLGTEASTAAYRAEPAGVHNASLAQHAPGLATAGTASMQPIPIPTPVLGPGG